jgi:hypothetical protein
MDKRSHWPFSVKNFPPSFHLPKQFEIEPVVMKIIYEDRFKGILGVDPIAHLKKFEKRCDTLKIKNLSNEIIKVKVFPYSLAGRAMDWVLNWPL